MFIHSSSFNKSPIPTPGQTSDQKHLRAAVAAGNKSAIGVLATTLSSLGVLDTGCTVSGALSLITPVEDPVVRVLLQLRAGGGSAGVSTACSVGSAVVGVVLVVSLEDGEGLGRGGTGVVGALGRLDGLGDLGG